jgi:hypothetical protein
MTQPTFSSNLFWDIELSDLDMEKHQAFIVGRVLDYGTWDDMKLIRNYYGMEKLKEIAMGIKSMFPESLAFVSTITHIPQNQFRCYEQLQSKNPLWNF